MADRAIEETGKGSVVASLVTAWVLVFGSVAIVTPVLFVVLGDPEPDTMALYTAVYMILTTVSVMVSFPRDPGPKTILLIILLSVVYYGIAALPGSFVGGMLAGLIGRVFA